MDGSEVDTYLCHAGAHMATEIARPGVENRQAA
jgi:hypothetical protein